MAPSPLTLHDATEATRIGLAITRWFLGAGHRVVAPDLIGFGKSDKPKREQAHGFLWHRQVLLELVERLDLRDVVFVGHSVSAMIGVLASIARPERFAQLVLVGPSPRYLNDADAGYVGGFERADIEAIGYNDANWCSDEYDKLYEQQNQELDREKRIEIVHQMLTLFHNESTYVVLYHDADTQAYRTDRFTGWVRQPKDVGPVLFSNTSPPAMPAHMA